MSRVSRFAGDEKRLLILEGEFRQSLIEALEKCIRGECELFGQNDASLEHLGKYSSVRSRWQEATTLLDLGQRIDSLRAKLVLPRYGLYQRYLEYRGRRDSNAPGEPKLARQLLYEIEEKP